MLLGNCKLKHLKDTTICQLYYLKAKTLEHQMLIRMWISGNSQLLLVGMQNDIATLKNILRVIT